MRPQPGTRIRKRLLNLLVEDATLTRQGYRAHIGLRLRGGKTWALGPVDLPKPRSTVVRRHASNAVLSELKTLRRAGAGDASAAEELNRRGHREL